MPTRNTWLDIRKNFPTIMVMEVGALLLEEEFNITM